MERAGIPALTVTDGPNGARGVRGTSACFPSSTALAATWDTALVERVGAALAEEALAKGARVLLAPTVNIHRHPLAGRSFECFSEDPHLSARMAAAYVRGVQGGGVGATVKHFVCNDSEFERRTISSEVAERALREIYLPPFEAAVREAGAWAVMTAYNRLNGTHCAQHPTVRSLLKEEWGFDGLVMSDWYGTHAGAASVAAGLDLEMPGPPAWMGPHLLEEVRGGRLPEAALDDQVRRLLRLLDRCRLLGGPVPDPPVRSPDRPEHRELARRAAAQAIVLLRNAGELLPLREAGLRTVAVIGPNAEMAAIQGGGSANVNPHRAVGPLGALREALGPDVRVEHEPGCPPAAGRPPLDDRLLDGKGLALAYHAGLELAGPPVLTEVVHRGRVVWMGAPAPGLPAGEFSVRGTGRRAPRHAGRHVLGLASAGRSRLRLDGRVVIDNWDGWTPGATFYGVGSDEVTAEVELEVGRRYELSVELAATSGPIAGLALRCTEPRPGDLLERAVALAAEADAAVVVVCTDDEWEREGADRASFALPPGQDELIERVAAANPRTVVVVNTGAPVRMDWADRVPAVLQAWFGGEEAGHALADVLLGRANPSGRLPTTIPRRLEDTPAFLDYPGENGRVRYGEGIFVGYRWYDRRRIEPRFCFGHGLSYTTFAYGPLELDRAELRPGETLVASVEITNTGAPAGAEVVQLYVADPESRLARPERELRGFRRTWLEPGQTCRLRFELDVRDLACWDPGSGGWVAEAGEFEITVGASSRDLRARARFALAQTSSPDGRSSA